MHFIVRIVRIWIWTERTDFYLAPCAYVCSFFAYLACHNCWCHNPCFFSSHPLVVLISFFHFIPRSNQNFFECYIQSGIGCLTNVGLNGKLDVVGWTHSWSCHIELSMCKYFPTEPHTNMFQRLALTFIYCGRKCRPDWELAARPIEWKFIFLWHECNSWQENLSICACNCTNQHPVALSDFVEDQPSAIAQTSFYVDVPEEG